MRAAIVRNLLALVALAAPVSADVLVVDADGGGDFQSLDAAIAAAADGDTLLLRPGYYPDFGLGLVISRSLVIAADGTGDVLTTQLHVNAPGKQVVLRGLRISPDPQFSHTPLTLVNSDVLVEGCTLLALDGSYFGPQTTGGDGIVAGGTGRLVVKDCEVQAGRGSDSQIVVALNAQHGGRGIVTGGAMSITIDGGSVSGGAGGDDFDGFVPGSWGGAGVTVSGGSLHVAGCTITGGDGGNSAGTSFSAPAQAGGHAVAVNGTSLSLLDVTLTGGAAGEDADGDLGAAGEALHVEGASTVVQFPGAYRSLACSAPAPEGGVMTLVYAGAAGDLVGLYVSTSSALLPGKQGPFHLGAPLLGPMTLGPVGPRGTLSLSFGIPNLGFGPEDAALLYGQAIVKPASDAMLLSSPTTALLIDNSL